MFNAAFTHLARILPKIGSLRIDREQKRPELDFLPILPLNQTEGVLKVRWVVFQVSLCALISHVAWGQTYASEPSDTAWATAVGPFACELTYAVKDYGRLTLSKKAGGAETARLQSNNAEKSLSNAVFLDTFPQTWQIRQVPVRVAEWQGIAGAISFSSSDWVAVSAQLQAGTRLMFSAKPASGSVVRVIIDPKGFSESHKKYQSCIKELIPYTFNQLARLTLSYGEKATSLSDENKNQLQKVARYTKADPKVLGILVDSHSDKSGTAEENATAAKQQADWIVEYLVSQGVAADKITARSHADQFPIGNNKTAAGRAQNRRVTVRLEDQNLRDETAKKQAEASAKAESAASVAADQNAAAAASSKPKMTPEEVSRMVEGLDLINGK